MLLSITRKSVVIKIRSVESQTDDKVHKKCGKLTDGQTRPGTPKRGKNGGSLQRREGLVFPENRPEN